MNKSIKKIMAIAVILAMTMAQTIVFANNVGLDPNGHIEMPLNVKTNRPQNITIKNMQNYQLAYQLVETPSENYKNYAAFIDESNAKKDQLVSEKNQLKSVVEAAMAEDKAKYDQYAKLHSDPQASEVAVNQAKAAWDEAKAAYNKAMEPYNAKLSEMEEYDKTTDAKLKSYIPTYNDSNWQNSDGTFTIPSNNDGKERIVTVWVRATDGKNQPVYEATMYPFNLGKTGNQTSEKKYTLSIEQGKDYQLSLDNYNPADFTWNTNPTGIVEISNGTIRGLQAGVTTLSGISNDGKTKVRVEVTVTPTSEQPGNNNPKPEDPSNNNKPTPEQPGNNNSKPEDPSNNNKPTPEQPGNNNPKPEDPSNNNKPTPEQSGNNDPKSEDPSNNNKPTPEQPGNNDPKPEDPNNNNKPTPEQPGNNNPKPEDSNNNKPNTGTNNQSGNNNNSGESTSNRPNSGNTSTKPNSVNINTNPNTNPQNESNVSYKSNNNGNDNIGSLNNNQNTRSSSINNQNRRDNSNTQKVKEINSGVEKDTPTPEKPPKRLPKTGDIPMGGVIAMAASGAIAIVMLIKTYLLKM